MPKEGLMRSLYEKERGTHNELMEKNGIYKDLWNAQAEYYKDTAGELFA